MIIREIYIDGFGIFQNYTLALPGKGIHIILGNNEAGKSTLMKFLKFTLFGYPRPHDQRMQPINGGNHGGRIKAQLSSGSDVLFERDGKDKIKLFYNGQESGNMSQWNQLLGNASASLYNNVYAFTLDELVSLSSITDSGMDDKIFSLGLGLGNISVSDIENIIRSRTDEIYTSRGRTQLVPYLLKEIDTKHAQIRQIQENLVLYQQLTGDIERIDNDTKIMENDLKTLRIEHATVENNLRCYHSFVMLNRIENELEQLPPFKNLPENGAQQMEKVLNQQEEYISLVYKLDNGTVEEKGIKEIGQLLEDIDVNELLLEKKEKVDFIRLNLAGYKQAKKERAEEGNRLKELDENISRSIAEKISSRWDELDVSSFSNMEAHKSKVEQFTDLLRKIADDKRDWEAREKAMMHQNGTFDTVGMVKILAAIFALSAIPALYYRLPVLGGILLLIALVLFFTRNAFSKTDPLIPVREKIKELSADAQKLLMEYKSWLERDMKLAPELSFRAMDQVFQTIDYVKELIGQRNRLRQKIQEERLPFIFDFEGKVGELKSRVDPGLVEVELLAQAIVSAYDHAEKIFQQKLQLTAELERKKKEKERVEDRIETNRKTIANLFKAVEVTSTEAFLQLYTLNDKVTELQLNRKNAMEKIEAIVGINKTEDVIEGLKTCDKQTLEIQLAELKNLIEEKEQQTKGLHTEKGARVKEKERLAGESDLAQKLTELETERQKLHLAYKDWMAGQLALKILSGARMRYEKEKQPAVIKNSSQLFQTITEGHYDGIRTTLEGRNVSVVNRMGVSRSIDQLSRGTKEQLLVSMRLGFIKEYETQAEPLPMIVDEILVNFDVTRARRTAQVLQNFSENRQILLFTCHPTMVSYFDQDKINVIPL